MAIMQNHPEIVRMLLDRGADPSIRDSLHDGDARGWAVHFNAASIIQILDQTV
jgi:hypothetical protein